MARLPDLHPPELDRLHCSLSALAGAYERYAVERGRYIEARKQWHFDATRVYESFHAYQSAKDAYEQAHKEYKAAHVAVVRRKKL